MIPEAAVWSIIGIPFACFVMIVAVIRPFMNMVPRVSGYVTIGGLTVAFILSVWAMWSVIVASSHSLDFISHEWFTIGEPGSGSGFQMTVGLLLDPLTAIMLVVITGVSLMVQIYSQGYMSGDKSYCRYFAFMSLFTASMLGLVLSRNLIQLFFFWELVGLSSYLLIGFWHSRPSAVAAAKKAFIVTRIGDFGFLLALLYLFSQRAPFVARGLNPFEIPDILLMAPLLASGVCTWLALGLFAGAMGKSAQFPLHTWLPDAMEGPTPVSSLIHAATMVAAGVFLVTRMFPLFDSSIVGSPAAQNIVTVVGSITALFAAGMAVVSHDIKRVLAYSTISQLGYMMIALGIGAPGVAMFHLFNHAFFKCLLFLGAGSVHHAVHTFDMRYMGGLRKVMPLTYWTMVIGGLSLAGVFPLAGFWSKDEILNVAWYGIGPSSIELSRVAFVVGLSGAFLTAIYITRLIYLTFHGDFRGGIDAVPEHERNSDELDARVHLHESPLVMTAPMLLLSLAAVASGYLSNATIGFAGIPAHWFSHMLGEEAPHFSWAVAGVSTVVAVSGVLLATVLYRVTTSAPAMVANRLGMLNTVLVRRFYMDELYEGVLVRRFLYQGVFRFSDWVDRRLVDGFIDLVAWLGRNSGRALAQVQTGHVQAYGAGIVVGVVVILSVYISQF